MSLDDAKWTKAALGAGVNALRALSREHDTMAIWVSTGASAVEAIDERSAVSLQRAVVQEAFRTVTDAFTALVRKTLADQPQAKGKGQARKGKVK